MIISAKVIKRPRISRLCCACVKLIHSGPIVRLYGSACDAPPHVLYQHPKCAAPYAFRPGSTRGQIKVRAALLGAGYTAAQFEGEEKRI